MPEPDLQVHGVQRVPEPDRFFNADFDMIDALEIVPERDLQVPVV